MDIRNLNMQGSTVHQQNIGDRTTATQTNTYAVPPEHQAAVEEMTRKVKDTVETPGVTAKDVLNVLMEYGWQNFPAFLAMLRAWVAR